MVWVHVFVCFFNALANYAHDAAKSVVGAATLAMTSVHSRHERWARELAVSGISTSLRRLHQAGAYGGSPLDELEWFAGSSSLLGDMFHRSVLMCQEPCARSCVPTA